jgi:Mrp family chromosome partitioning ATPase
MSEKDPTEEKLDKMFGRHKDGTPLKLELNARSTIRRMFGVVSGKGGVGKSFVTAAAACEMQRRGRRTAVLDGDITGPSQGRMFGVSDKLYSDGQLAIPARTKTGIQLVSANMMLEKDTQPVIWRGPMVAGVLQQYLQEVWWDDVDVMFVDMPPGTGDVPLTVFQQYPVDGILVVTSPQDLVRMVVEKAINMADMMHIPIVGLIENMSYVECSACGQKMYVFGPSHAKEVAEEFQLPLLASIPLREGYALAGDQGTMEDLQVPEIAGICDALEDFGKEAGKA